MGLERTVAHYTAANGGQAGDEGATTDKGRGFADSPGNAARLRQWGIAAF